MKIYINRRNSYILLFGLFIAMLIFFLSDLTCLLSLFYIYSFVIVYFYSGRSILDPRVIIVSFLTIYSTFFAVRVGFTGDSLLPLDYEILARSLQYQFLSLFVFVTIINIIIDDKKKLNERIYPVKSLFSEKLIFILTIPFALLAIYSIYKSGVSSKAEILSGTSRVVMALFLFSSYLSTSIMVLRSLRLKGRMAFDGVLFFYIFFCFYIMILAGERDIFFRIAFIIGLLYFDCKKFNTFRYVLIILFLVVFIVPFSQALKAILLVGHFELKKVGFSFLFGNEFISSGRNFYSLLFYGVNHDLSYFFCDIVRAFLPSIFLPGFQVESVGSWFHNVYRVEHGFSGSSGWGFTLAGEGYLIASSFGILLIMALYSIVIGVSYNMRSKSVYWYVFYLLTLSTSVYVIRADLANFLSQVFKIGGLSIFIIYFFHILFLKLKKIVS